MDLISEDKLRNIAAEKGFNLVYLEKDYFLTVLLYCLKDVEGIHFKGGTALNKLLLNHKRLSEDLDFTATIPVKQFEDEVNSIVKENESHFKKTECERKGDAFTRIKVYYKSYFTKNAYVAIDANRKASIHLQTERKNVPNFYGLNFEINALNLNELFAEKLRAAITRNQPRDYFDLYFILKKFEVDMKLVEKKVREAGENYDVERIFKNANKIYSNWNAEISNLTNTKLEYLECIKFLHEKLRKK